MILTAPLSSSALVPTLTSSQAKAVDNLTSERFGVPVLWLMEAAGWQVARQATGTAFVLCGHGNNGGDGLAAARHLNRWERLAGVACTDRSRLAGPASEEARALEAQGVVIRREPDFGQADLVVDAMLGTGLTRDPEGLYTNWIEAANESGLDVLAVDVPSGLESDSGLARRPCVKATATVTLGLPKPGLLEKDGPRVSGEIWLADIGIPRQAYLAAGVDVPEELFANRDVFRLR